MANFVFTYACGRGVQWYDNVDTNNPTNAALIWMVLATTGLETDAVLQDSTDFADVLGGATNEVTNTNYARVTWTDATISAWAADTANNRIDLDGPDLSWTGVAAGDGWSKLVSGYDNDTTGGTDSNIVPFTAHDFVVTPDGSDITAQLNAAGFFRASAV